MSSIETPYGRLSWSGVLEEDTLVTVTKTRKDGEPIVNDLPLSRMIAMTNGGILPYLPPHPNDIPAPAGVVFPT